MALEKQEYVERIVIVLNPDGTLKGAHQETLTHYVDDGTIVASRQQTPVGVDSATLSRIVPASSVLLAQVQHLLADKTELSTMVTELAVEVARKREKGP